MSSSEPERRFTFPATHRLRRQREFDAVYRRGVGKTAGPLRIIGLPNAMDHCRLGMSVSKRIGGAVVRNRLKRMLREAYRLSRHELPGGYDLVIVPRPHPPLGLEDYQRMLLEAVGKLHRHWTKIQAEP